MEIILNQTICLKQYLSDKEYEEVNELANLCSLQDKTNLKLELDYKINMRKNHGIGLKTVNEFLYYVEDTLAAYIGISSFGSSNNGEINGMTHPGFRRKGIFKKLFELAMDECRKRNFRKVLLLSDGNSQSGIEFIKSVGGKYDFSEYRMKRLNETDLKGINPVKLRKAVNSDGKEIGRQNAIYFDREEEYESSPEEYDCLPEENEKLNMITYMAELKGAVIGKINVDYSDNSAFICGFGILPDFRGKGYGKAALHAALQLIKEKHIHDIELDVECRNNTALNLYKTCGFEEQSVMNYYLYNI